MLAENTHEAIIDPVLWARVQELLGLKAKPFGNGKTGLFSRKAKCMYCGYAMRTAKSHDRYYLKCGTKHTAADACIGSFISVDALEQGVLLELNALLNKYLNTNEVIRSVKLSDDITERIAKLEADKDACAKKKSEYSKAVKSLYLDKVRGIISEEDFINLSADFSKDREGLETIEKDIENEIAALTYRNSVKRDKSQIIEQYRSIERLDRIMVERLIDNIRVGKREKDSRQVPIEIHWSF